MSPQDVLDFIRIAIFVFLKTAMPILFIGLAIGLIISIFQTLTQLQETTLTFVPKILIVFFALIFLLPFMYNTIAHLFTVDIIDKISVIP